MKVTYIIEAASDAIGHATEVAVRHGGKLVERISGSAVKAFLWNGAAFVLSLTHMTDSSDEEYRVPDIAAELNAIEAKMSDVGEVEITIKIKPKQQPEVVP